MEGRFTFYKGWHIYRSSIGSQTWVAERHGVTMRANSRELLYTKIDTREPLRLDFPEYLTKEDIEKYGTEDEKEFLKK